MVQGKKIGITGGAGFLGRRLAKRLAIDNDVTILDVRQPSIADKSPSLNYVRCDVTDKAQCVAGTRGLDVIFHRVGLMGNVPSMRAAQRYYEVNIEGTVNVLEACAKNHVTRLIFDSTEAVYGINVTSPITEEQPARPTSLYGATKLAAERAVRLFDERYGLSTLTFRYCRIREAETRDAIWILAGKVLNAEPITLYDGGEPVIDFVSVDDVIRANILAAGSDAHNEIINISTGQGISFNEMVAAIEDIAGTKAASIRFEYASRERPGAEHLFGPAKFYLDIQKASRLLGWQPQISLDDSIRATVALVRKQAAH